MRLYNLGGQSLWFDEGWSWHLAKLPLNEMALVTAGDRSPPLYYALLHGWIALVGQREFAMRFVSVLADTLTVALVMRFAAELERQGDRVTGRQGVSSFTLSPFYLFTPSFVAGLIYAIMPFAVWYAQEARMYALVAMLCTASSLCLWKWIRRSVDDRSPSPMASRTATYLSPEGRGIGTRGGLRRHKLLAASALLLIAAIYCHYYAIFLLPAQVVTVMLTQLGIHSRDWLDSRLRGNDARKRITTYLFTSALILAALIPWLLVASAGFAYDDGFFFPLNTIDGRLMEWVRGYANAGLAQALPSWWPIALGLPVVLGVIGFVAKRNWRGLLTVLVLIGVPLLAATVAVRVVYPNRSVFHPRYLIYVAPMTAVLFAAVWMRVRSHVVYRLLSIISLVCLAALWLPLDRRYLTDPALQREDTRGAVKHVAEAIEPGDAIIMARDNFAVRYYWPMDKAAYLLAEPAGLHGVLTQDVGVIGALNRAPLKRVRLMLWQDDVVDPQKFVESALWPNGFEVGEFNFAQIRLPLYQVDHWPMQPPDFVERSAVFGGQLALHSTWQRDRGFAGDWFYIILNWQPRVALHSDYKVFVHVLDATGKLMWQNDKLPLNALLPMTRWQPGQTYRDAHAMVIPADVPAGRYQVVAGVYDPLTNQRLTTSDGLDHALLGEVEVMRR